MGRHRLPYSPPPTLFFFKRLCLCWNVVNGVEGCFFYPARRDTHTHTSSARCERIHLKVTSWITWMSRHRLWVEPLKRAKFRCWQTDRTPNQPSWREKTAVCSSAEQPPRHGPWSMECAHVPEHVASSTTTTTTVSSFPESYFYSRSCARPFQGVSAAPPVSCH